MAGWRFTYEGETWAIEDYLLSELEEVEKRLDLPGWYALVPQGKAQHAACLLAVWLRRKLSEDEVAGILERMTLGDFLRIAHYDEQDVIPTQWDDTSPKEGSDGEAVTTGSAGPGSEPDGLQA
jgi:hypothetical protein